MRHPIAFKSADMLRAAVMSSAIALSVISTVAHSRGNPASSAICRICLGKVRSFSCSGEILNASRRPFPWSVIASNAFCRTWLLTSPIKPLLSAKGMKVSGEIVPTLGVLPTCEHLKTVKLARCENHKWLKIRKEFPVFQCTAKVPLIKFLCRAHNHNMLG